MPENPINEKLMKMEKPCPIYILIRIAVLLVIVLISFSCNRGPRHPGYDYYPDMVNSNAYETYSMNPNYSDSVMSAPPKAVISRNRAPHLFDKSSNDRLRAGLELANPFLPGEETILSGKMHYERICIVCHGATGNGRGHLVTTGKYLYFPANLSRPEMQTFPEGEIFHVITRGYGMMGSHAYQLLPGERWQVCIYIKNVLSNPSDVIVKNQE